MKLQDKQMVLELYKAHFTAKEATEILPYSYSTIIAMFRSFEVAGIHKYDRFQLISQSRECVA